MEYETELVQACDKLKKAMMLVGWSESDTRQVTWEYYNRRIEYVDNVALHERTVK